MKTAIVTGVTGQMGSFFSEFLLGLGFRVIGTVRRLSVKNHKNIEHVSSPNFILCPMDLGDVQSINSVINAYKPDFFVNCAANSFVGSSWDFPEQHFQFNAIGVLRQLEAIRRYSPTTRYLNFGSSEEFGDVAYSPQDDKHPGRARSPYGASKIAARQIVKVYRESYNLYAIQCWCFNYEGTRRGEEFVTRKITQAVARITKSLRDGIPIIPLELGNLDAKRDWSDCEDFVDGVWRMLNQEIYRPEMEQEYHSGHILLPSDTNQKYVSCLSKQIKEYVLSSGETHTVREFVELAFKEASIPDARWIKGGKAEDEYYWSDIFNCRLVQINPKFYRAADVEILIGNSNPIREELGWSPKVSFKELITKMVRYDMSLIS